MAAFAATVVLAAPLATFATGESWERGKLIDVPSGQSITFLDLVVTEDDAIGKALRYRFLAPRIARTKGDIVFSQAEEDMAVICQDYVLPNIVTTDAALPDQIIIVLSDRPVEFGVANPDATQFFEAFRPEDGICIWEGF